MKRQQKETKAQADFLAWLNRQPDANPDAVVSFESGNRVRIKIPGEKRKPPLYTYQRDASGGFKLKVSHEVSSHAGEVVDVPVASAETPDSAPRPSLCEIVRGLLLKPSFDFVLPGFAKETYPVMHPTRMVKDPKRSWRDEDNWQPNPRCPTLADHVAGIIHQAPATLLDPEYGPALVSQLVELLTAAKHGDCARRSPGLVPEYKITCDKKRRLSRKQVAAHARKAIALLTKQERGQSLELNPFWTYRCIYELAQRIARIQADWKTHRRNDRFIRMKYDDELEGISRKMIYEILREKPVAAALIYAAKEAGTKPKTIAKALGNQRRQIELSVADVVADR